MENLLNQTKDLCRQYGIIPARSKGQNFLITPDFYDKIVDAADLKSDDVVLEVGPGLGFLTAKLAAKVKKVIAVELDDKLAKALNSGLAAKGVRNIEVVNANILDLPPLNSCLAGRQVPLGKGEDPKGKGYKVVANLPYNITSVFLRKFLSGENKPESMVLMLQKEVAERIVAKAGQMSILAVSVQFYAEAEIIGYVPKNNFWPEPEVDSAIIKLKVKSGKLKVSVGVDKERDFFRMVKFGFSSKRKMLKNNLAAGYHISNQEADNLLKLAGFNQKIRAQELSVDDWLKLFGIIQENML